MKSAVHPFERAGFGHAPYRCLRASRMGGAGSSCDYCGTGIMDVFRVRSSDGVEFKVGCDCIRKVYTEFDGAIPPDFRAEVARMEAEKRDAKREAKWQQCRFRVMGARELLAARPTLFTGEPHPNAYHAGRGLTRRDYIGFLLQHGGQSGKTDACRMIERAFEAARRQQRSAAG